MNATRRRTIAALAGAAALLAAGCATEPVPKLSLVASGEEVIRGRLAVRGEPAWNRFDRGPEDRWPMWTQEGLTIDTLTFVVGVKDGEALAPPPKEPTGQKPLVFRAAMAPGDIVELLRSLWTRDGSSFTLERLVPEDFAGGPGFRFEYAFVRRTDDLRMQGVAWCTVRDGELFVVDFMALRLNFFARLRPSAEAVARSARLTR